jgi:hypothetical protein
MHKLHYAKDVDILVSSGVSFDDAILIVWVTYMQMGIDMRRLETGP